MGWGGIVGLTFGLGAYAIILGIGPLRARAYILRIDRFLGAPNQRGHSLAMRVIGTTRLERIGLRQGRAGRDVDPSAYVLSLVIWCVAGLGVGSIVVVGLTSLGKVHQPLAALPLLTLFIIAAGLLHDRQLDLEARRRRERATTELPALAEGLAIAVSAGAALAHACELVAAESSGVLAAELSAVVREVREGSTLDPALRRLAERIPAPSVARFVEALRIALERGTPVVEVLHAQAADARNEARRQLMEQAGRREVAMLIPVVFLVLPAVVVIALYPGFRELTSMV